MTAVNAGAAVSVPGGQASPRTSAYRTPTSAPWPTTDRHPCLALAWGAAGARARWPTSWATAASPAVPVIVRVGTANVTAATTAATTTTERRVGTLPVTSS